MSKIGSGAKDIFSRKKPATQKNIEKRDDSPKKAGRPKVHKSEVLKTVITLRKDQLIWLDQLALNIRASSDAIIDRGLLIRAFISFAMESGIDFSKVKNEEQAKDLIIDKLKGK